MPVAPELPIRNDQTQSGPHDWGIGKWTTPRAVKSFVRVAKSRLMVVPSPSRPPSASVRTAGSHFFFLTSFSRNRRRFEGKRSVETHTSEPRPQAASFTP